MGIAPDKYPLKNSNDKQYIGGVFFFFFLGHSGLLGVICKNKWTQIELLYCSSVLTFSTIHLAPSEKKKSRRSRVMNVVKHAFVSLKTFNTSSGD